MTITQPVIRFDLERDVRTTEGMAARLTPYIYESELFGQMSGDLPRLTVGGLLMRLHRLSALPNILSQQQQKMVATAQEQLDKVRKDWAVAYEGKLKQEMQTRLTAFGQFINELGENPRHSMDIYSSGIEKRVIIEALKDEAASRGVLTPELQTAVSSADDKLRR